LLKSSNQDPKKELEELSLALIDFLSGSLTINVNNFPFLKINCETRSLTIEIKGFKQTGFHLGDLLGKGDNKKGLMETMKESSGMAHRLHDLGWELQLFEGEDSVLAMGRGVSSLTGYVWFNPLKLSKIIEII